MEVGDQYRVDAAKRAGVDLGRPAQVRDAVPEQRVGEQADAVEVDEDGCVADVRDPRRWESDSLTSRSYSGGGEAVRRAE